MWECGLKFGIILKIPLAFTVTPCVGVWIEIIFISLKFKPPPVTPCVGVWIEILKFPCQPSYKIGHSLCGSVD